MHLLSMYSGVTAPAWSGMLGAMDVAGMVLSVLWQDRQRQARELLGAAGRFEQNVRRVVLDGERGRLLAALRGRAVARLGVDSSKGG